jgi:hypothetical protein
MALTTRPRLYHPLRDERGDLLRYARVRVLLEDGKTPYPGKIYRDGTSTKTYSNPFVAAPALVSFYLLAPARVRLAVQADISKPEIVGDVLDVTFDADRTVDTAYPLRVEGEWVRDGLLCGLDDATAYWKPLRVDHEHATVAPNAILAGASGRGLRQVGGFPGSTTIGADTGGWGAASSLRDTSMLGSMAEGYGRGTTALGRDTLAEEDADSPWTDGATAAGLGSYATAAGVGLGAGTIAGAAAVAAGLSARGGDGSVALGRDARPSTNGVAIGVGTGMLSSGAPGSIGLGAGAQYGLPSSPSDTAVLLGAYDPARARLFPWANPAQSQSESPFEELGVTMAFAGRTVQLQRGLEWVADITALQVGGDATLAGRGGLLGFYGAAPRTKQGLGDDEPGSGITALDNLIYALRELGLIGFRTEASMTYRAEDLDGWYRDGDHIRAWPERSGVDQALPSAATSPEYDPEDSDGRFNDLTATEWENSVYRRSTRPAQEMRSVGQVRPSKHYVAVAQHSGSFGNNEGLFNLATVPPSPAGEVFTSDAVGSTTWQMNNATKYALDGLDQTSNRQAGPGAQPHVYRMSHPTSWPAGQAVIGGPRNSATPQPWDRWSGHIAEVVGMDDSWSESAVQSMVNGLMFKYGIRQSDDALREPAEDFLITQHDPMNGTLVFFKKDYKDSYTGKVQGRAVRVPKSVIFIPFISIYIAFSTWSFRGALVGNWGNLAIGVATEYEVAVSVKIGDLDEDGDLDVDVDFDVETETYVGIFALNNNFTWSMGQLSSRYGYKVCRIRHRVTKVVVCISGDSPFRYADTDVQLYSTRTDGTLRLEATTPLWGDGTFKGWVKNSGKKVARVVEHSTGNVLGTTEYQEKALPRTALYADDDPEVSFANRDRAYVYESALTALAILGMDDDHRYRARHILATLRLVCNDDGTLNESYSAVLPAKTTPGGNDTARRWGAVWTVLAVLRYTQATGDNQFLAFAQQLADKLVTQTHPETHVRAALYFALRDLGQQTGVSSYATAAQTARSELLSAYWLTAGQRWRESTASDAESLWATALGGLFALAVGDRDKARASIQHLRRFRVKGATISAPHYSGASGLIGYKPYADLGSLTPHLNPPAVIDQAGTWAAILFKMRYGEPIGDDVAALYRWQQTQISSDPAHALYAAQFLSYSANATSNGYALRARPHLAAAGWGHLLSKGGRALFTPDPRPTPTPLDIGLTISYDRAAGRYLLRYSWRQDLLIPAAGYEAVVERSVDAGSSWSAASSTQQGSTLSAADPGSGADWFAAAWSTAAPDNPSAEFRVRIRLRNASFGAWVTGPSVGLPPTA